MALKHVIAGPGSGTLCARDRSRSVALHPSEDGNAVLLLMERSGTPASGERSCKGGPSRGSGPAAKVSAAPQSAGMYEEFVPDEAAVCALLISLVFRTLVSNVDN